MSDLKFSITWDSYHNYVSKGFSSLQQNGDFVDMTLAADGHLVKVHQNIVALASPYLKAMLQSATCRHPIIFLHNINSDILGYILEYIYTGEVKIPTSIMDIFLKACKSLCINGLDTIITSKVLSNVVLQNTSSEEISPNQRIDKPMVKDIAAHITINTQDNNIYNLEVIPNHNNIVNNNSTGMFSEQPSTILHDNERNYKGNKNNETDNFSSINNLFVFKPNSGAYNNIEFNRIHSDSNIKILSNIKLPSQNSDIMKPAVAMQEHTWNPNTNFVDIVTLNNNGLQPEPGQSNEHTDLDTQVIQDTFDNLTATEKEEITFKLINRKNPLVLKNLKKITSHMKLKIQPKELKELPRLTLNRVEKIKMDKVPHFTISNRGALQLILNQFLYHTHHYSHGGRKRRWRCVEYRKSHCPAFIDTDNEEIMSMSADHLHPNHENIIRKKMKSNIVFTSLSNAVNIIHNVLKDQQEEPKYKSVKQKVIK